MIKITDELRDAIEQEQGLPVKLEDDKTKKVYLLVDKENAQNLFDQWLRRELQIGFDQADRGEVVPWDPERIKAEGRHRPNDSSS